jgi:hypothetical protein
LSFITKTLHTFLSMPHVPPTSFSILWSTYRYLGMNTNYEVQSLLGCTPESSELNTRRRENLKYHTNNELPHCATSSLSGPPVLKHPQSLPFVWATMFHTHTKQLAELWFCICSTFTVLDSRLVDRLWTKW